MKNPTGNRWNRFAAALAVVALLATPASLGQPAYAAALDEGPWDRLSPAMQVFVEFQVEQVLGARIALLMEGPLAILEPSNGMPWLPATYDQVHEAVTHSELGWVGDAGAELGSIVESATLSLLGETFPVDDEEAVRELLVGHPDLWPLLIQQASFLALPEPVALEVEGLLVPGPGLPTPQPPMTPQGACMGFGLILFIGTCLLAPALAVVAAVLVVLFLVLNPVLAAAGGALGQVDQNRDGLGDEWVEEWRQRIGQVLQAALDPDQDGLDNVGEFRWQLVPVCVPPPPPTGGPGAVQNCKDFERNPVTGAGGDAWWDGPEVDYWNDPSNDNDVSLDFAFYDRDRLLDTDGDGIVNVRDPDSDNDGLLDGEEAQTWGTYPEFLDSDCSAELLSCTPSTDSSFHDASRQGRPGTGDGIHDSAEQDAWNALGPQAWRTPFDADDVSNNLLDPDADDDGLLDGQEFLLGQGQVRPDRPDTDGDGLQDGDEVAWHEDTDFDGRVNANDPDSDDDGMPDAWEAAHHFNMVDPTDAALDRDGDLLVNLGEYQAATDPSDMDTEDDLLLDGEEVNVHATNPHTWDTDGDGMADRFETDHSLNPQGAQDAILDADGDSFDQNGDAVWDWFHSNLEEYRYGRPPSWTEGAPNGAGGRQGPWLLGTNPRDSDTDDDVASDGFEVHFGTDPRVPANVQGDDDQDGLAWEDEFAHGTDPHDPDTDDDGLCDGGRGPRCFFPTLGGTGNQPGESDFGSIPWSTDTDGDELSDWAEAEVWDPDATGQDKDIDADGAGGLLDPDSDDDGLGDGREQLWLLTDPRRSDTDDDGLKDGPEVDTYGTDPHVPDSDGDLARDGDEVDVHKTNPAQFDTDGDFLGDGSEVGLGTNPLNPDTDVDGLRDGWEAAVGTNPRVDDASLDPDNDELSNLGEAGAGTQPLLSDTDVDGMPDGWEVRHNLYPLTASDSFDSDFDGLTDLLEFARQTLPGRWDTDLDALGDGAEANLYRTDPLATDTDLDGLLEGAEASFWGPNWNRDWDLDAIPSNLVDTDSDNDGLDDGDEVLQFHTNPTTPHSDNDGLTDYQEVVVHEHRYDPNHPDTDRDGVSDAQEVENLNNPDFDSDDDGLTNGQEDNVYSTDKNRRDTDCDGAPDGAERAHWAAQWNAGGNRLLVQDWDGDGILDGLELGTAGTSRQALYRTDPALIDSDGDGLLDSEEARNNVKVACNNVQASAGPPASAGSTPGFPTFTEPIPGAPLFLVWATLERQEALLTDVLYRDSSGIAYGMDDVGLYIQGGYGVRLFLSPSPEPDSPVPDSLTFPMGAPGTNGKLTDPSRPDTDGDGLGDGEELQGSRNPHKGQGANPNLPGGNTDPLACDSDADGLGDGLELGIDQSRAMRPETPEACRQRDVEVASGTNPNHQDTDADGLFDGPGVKSPNGKSLQGEDTNANGRADANGNEGDPTSQDGDGDGLPDITEFNTLGAVSCVLNPDCDGDTLLDGLELAWNENSDADGDFFNFRDSDSDNDGVPDGKEGLFSAPDAYGRDFDGDGLKNMLDADADNDGFRDGIEDKAPFGELASLELNPLNSDTDGDGVIDGRDIHPLSATSLLSIDFDFIQVLDEVDCSCGENQREAEFYIGEFKLTSDPAGNSVLLDLVATGVFGGNVVTDATDGFITDLRPPLQLGIPQDIGNYVPDFANGDVSLYLWISAFDKDLGGSDPLDISGNPTGFWKNNGNSYIYEISLKTDFYSKWGQLSGINGELDGSRGQGFSDQDDVLVKARFLDTVPVDLITQLIKSSTKLSGV